MLTLETIEQSNYQFQLYFTNAFINLVNACITLFVIYMQIDVDIKNGAKMME